MFPANKNGIVAAVQNADNEYGKNNHGVVGNHPACGAEGIRITKRCVYVPPGKSRMGSIRHTDFDKCILRRLRPQRI